MTLKELFVKSDGTESSVTNIPVSNPVQNTPVQKESPRPVSTISTTSLASSEDIVNKLWKEIIDKNLPGPDYLELKNNFNALNDMPLSDEQKLISAFKIIKANHPDFSKDKILSSIETYINIVNEEKSEGLKEVARMRVENVNSKEIHIETLKKQAESLKNEYDSVIRQIEEETTSVAAEKLSIDNSERTFVASVETVINTLTSDKSKISTLNI